MLVTRLRNEVTEARNEPGWLVRQQMPVRLPRQNVSLKAGVADDVIQVKLREFPVRTYG